jgi:hypothetical protein
LQEQYGKPPVDYEYVMYPFRKGGDHGFGGFRWDDRTRARWDIPIDDTMEFQGSCWLMTKDWFNKNNLFRDMGYTGWGQEAEEIGFTTWLRGGRVVTNKNTWFKTNCSDKSIATISLPSFSAKAAAAILVNSKVLLPTAI